MKYQAIVELGDRVWDSIRSTKDQALLRVCEYLIKDESMYVEAVGYNGRYALVNRKDAVAVLENAGFTVEIKEIQ